MPERQDQEYFEEQLSAALRETGGGSTPTVRPSSPAGGSAGGGR